MTPTHIGRYRVLGLLGQGAMGVVYRGRDETLDRDVALKVMHAQSVDEDSRARFLREARAAARLQHPNIVIIYELGDHAGAPFMAMELLEGVDLQRAIEGGLRPNPRVTLPIVLQLLAGLGHAHEHGIVHRDVKPSNVFLPRGRPAKIMDFGVARLGGAATSTGLVVGTPNYMSPEQVGAHHVDGRSDLFSAGLILYELVTGEKAYQAATLVAVLYKITHEEPDFRLLPRGGQWERLRAVLKRALARNPDERYPDAAAMATDLALALQELGGSVDGAAPSDRGVMRTAPWAAPARPEETRQPPPQMPLLQRVEVDSRQSTVNSQQPTKATPPPPAPRPPSPGRARGAVAIPSALALLLAGLAWRWLGTPRRVEVATRLEPPPPASAPAAPPRSTTPALSPLPEARPTTSPPASPSPRIAPSPRTAAFSPPPASPVPRPSPRVKAPETDGQAGAARLEKANALYEQGRYNAALAEARAVLRQWPGNAEARALVDDIEVDVAVETSLKKAREALKRGDREAALEQVRTGLAVRSTDARLIALFRELTR